MKDRLRAAAIARGFTRVGFCRGDEPLEDPEPLHRFVNDGRHAGMRYLAKGIDSRLDPRALLPSARSILVVTAAYPATDRSALAGYAQLRDYHREMTTRLEGVLSDAQSIDASLEGRVCVDTKPILERAAAAKAGVGWIGKSTMLLDEASGPWTMLGLLILSAEIPPDEAAKHRCGTCDRCLVACPTDAFIAPYQLDARRCISYWTIEHRGPIPHEFRAPIGHRLFGCDECLTACPFGPPRLSPKEQVLPVADELRDLDPIEVIRRLDDGFNRNFKRFAISRAGKAGLLRNALTVLGNRGSPGDADEIARHLRHENVGVRSHAAWGLGRVGDASHLASLRQVLPSEVDADVAIEISAAIEQIGRRVTPQG